MHGQAIFKAEGHNIQEDWARCQVAVCAIAKWQRYSHEMQQNEACTLFGSPFRGGGGSPQSRARLPGRGAVGGPHPEVQVISEFVVPVVVPGA